jgi:hypothetical protein
MPGSEDFLKGENCDKYQPIFTSQDYEFGITISGARNVDLVCAVLIFRILSNKTYKPNNI